VLGSGSCGWRRKNKGRIFILYFLLSVNLV
jgi:hypothetical protein